MNSLINNDLEMKMDKAYHYLAENIRKTGDNPKPVLLHSIRISYHLYRYGYDENIVIGAILHDILEDTDVTYDNLLKEFGEDIADIVNSVSFKPNISNKIEQTKEVFERTKEYGLVSSIIKCADMYDNMPYIKLVDNDEITLYLKTKYKMFIEMFEDILKEEKIYKEYLERYKECI